MPGRGPALRIAEPDAQGQIIVLAGFQAAVLQRDPDGPGRLRGDALGDHALLHHLPVRRKLPAGLVSGIVRIVLPVADLHRPRLIHQGEGERLGGLLHLPHLGLGRAVGPDAAIGAGAGAVGPEMALVRLALEVEPEHRLRRIEAGSGLHGLGEDAHVVDQRIADVVADVLPADFLVAADAKRQRQVADPAGGGLGSQFPPVHVEFHPGAVIDRRHVVPAVLPVLGKRSVQRDGTAVVDIEFQPVTPLAQPELVGALGDEVPAAAVEPARQHVR